MLYQWADCTEQLQEIYASNPEAIYIAVDGPKNTNGDDHTLTGSSIQGWTVTGISRTSKNQDVILEAEAWEAKLKDDDRKSKLFVELILAKTKEEF